MTNIFYKVLILISLVIFADNAFAQKKKDKKGKTVESAAEPFNPQVEAAFIEASKQRILGNFKVSKAAYERVLELDPQNAAAKYELSRLYYEAGDFVNALLMAEEANEIEANNKWFLLQLAEMRNTNGDAKGASKVFQKLTEINPDEYNHWYDYAFMLIQANNSKNALKILDQMERDFGLDEGIARLREQVYLSNGEVDKAALQLESLILKYPNEGRYYGMLAELYQSVGEDEKAINVYKDLLAVDPGNPFANIALARYYKENGDDAKYNALMTKALGSKDLNVESKIRFLFPYINFINGETESEESKEAFELLEMVKKTHPNSAQVKAVEGDFLLRAEKKEEALNAYKASVEMDPNSFTVWQQILFLVSEKNNHNELIEQSNAAIEVFPNQPLPYFFSGYAHNRKKDYDQAIKQLKQGSLMGGDNNPMQVQILSQLADAYNSKKEFEKSDESFDEALKIDPNNATALNNYSYYLSIRGENLEKASEMAKKANELEPDNSSFQDTYAWVLYKMRDYENAEIWLMKAYNNGAENNSTILEHLGDVYYRLDQKEKAVEFWERALTGDGIDDEEKLQQKINQRKLIE